MTRQYNTKQDSIHTQSFRCLTKIAPLKTRGCTVIVNTTENKRLYSNC